MRLQSYNQNRRQTLKRLIEISRPVIETAGTLAKNQPSTRESKRSSGQHNNIGPNIPEPSVHGTKLEPKRLAKNSKYRRDNHPKLKPPPQANLHRKAYTLNFIILLHRSHQRTRESWEHPETTLIIRPRKGLLHAWEMERWEEPCNFWRIKGMLCSSHTTATITPPLIPLMKPDITQTLQTNKDASDSTSMSNNKHQMG